MGMVLVLRSYGCVWFSYKWNKWVFTPELTLPNNNESDLPLYTLSKEKDTIFFSQQIQSIRIFCGLRQSAIRSTDYHNVFNATIWLKYCYCWC